MYETSWAEDAIFARIARGGLQRNGHVVLPFRKVLLDRFGPVWILIGWYPIMIQQNDFVCLRLYYKAFRRDEGVRVVCQ